MAPVIDNIIKKYKLITVLVMSFMYIFVGLKHFTDPQYFVNITPPQIQHKIFVVHFTGVLEILGGLLILNKKTRMIGALYTYLSFDCGIPCKHIFICF